MKTKNLLLSAATATLLISCGNTHHEGETPVEPAPAVTPPVEITELVPVPELTEPSLSQVDASAAQSEAISEAIVTGSYIRRDNVNLPSLIDSTAEHNLGATASAAGSVALDQRFVSKRKMAPLSQGHAAYVPQEPISERYEDVDENGVKLATEHPVSTFSNEETGPVRRGSV